MTYQTDRVIEAARRLHDAIGCHYGDFTEVDSECGVDVYEAAKAFVAAFDGTADHGVIFG